MREITIDCFCGGGGASLGYEMATGLPITIAINHDKNAIDMHEKNHPGTTHLTEDIFSVDLRKYLLKGDIVRFMWASPDCTSHSKAKGGQPRISGLRILPWAVYRLCRQIKDATGSLPELIIMENVEEIQQWGPLDENGHPIKERAGEDYRKFINAMKKLGFCFDSRELVAADYGAPTTRKRWYAIFRSDHKAIVWPAPTHSRHGTDGLIPWVPISTCMDFSDLGKSIFHRKKPLAEKTQIRIANGIDKFIIHSPHPFIVPDNLAMEFLRKYYSGTNKMEGLDASKHNGMVAAFITKFYKSGTGQTLFEPIHTITTSPGHFAIVSVFLVKYYGQGTGQPITAPIGTITTKDRFGMCSVVYEIQGEKYIIYDVFLRMLRPEELKLGQSFTSDYIIDFMVNGRRYPVKEQVARIGNSVVPLVAKALIEVNAPYLIRWPRTPNLQLMPEPGGQLRFA